MIKGVKTARFRPRRIALIVAVVIIVALLALSLHPDSMKPLAASSADFESACRKISLLKTVSGVPPQSLSETEVNVYMDAVVARAQKLDDTGLVASRIKVVRLVLEKDTLIVQVARTLGPFILGPVNLGTIESSYVLAGVPEAGEDGFSFRLKSGRRGRLPVPAALCGSAMAELTDFFSKLKQEREFLNRIATIKVRDGDVVVSMRPLR